MKNNEKENFNEIMNSKNMNGFQKFAAFIFMLLVLGSFGITFKLAIAGGENALTVGLLYLVLSSIFFFFMYSLGEIIKQLRTIAELLNNNKK